MNLAVCGSLSRSSETAGWYRAVQLRFLHSALSAAHTKTWPTRFNAGALLPVSDQYEILHFAEDPQTAMFELGAVCGRAHVPGGTVAHPRLPFAMLNVRVTLRDVVDLTDLTSQARLLTTAQELTGDWEGYQLRGPGTSVPGPAGIAPTHDLGLALFQTTVEGFRAVSARVPYSRTLMVFPQNMQPGSSLVFRDQAGPIVHHVP